VLIVTSTTVLSYQIVTETPANILAIDSCFRIINLNRDTRGECDRNHRISHSFDSGTPRHLSVSSEHRRHIANNHSAPKVIPGSSSNSKLPNQLTGDGLLIDEKYFPSQSVDDSRTKELPCLRNRKEQCALYGANMGFNQVQKAFVAVETGCGLDEQRSSSSRFSGEHS